MEVQHMFLDRSGHLFRTWKATIETLLSETPVKIWVFQPLRLKTVGVKDNKMTLQIVAVKPVWLLTVSWKPAYKHSLP